MKPVSLFCLSLVLISVVIGLAGEPKKVNELNKFLLQAATDGNIDNVESLLSQGAEVDAIDSSRKTALHIASGAGHKEIVELLLAHGADVNAGAYYNRTAAEFAMDAHHDEIVRLLVSKGADISPLHLAIYLKDEAKARSLIEAGADVNKRTPYGTSPLQRAVDAGFKGLAELLIAKGADVNAKDNWDWTPLHSAAYKSKDMVELLLANGANINAKDGDGRTPLWYARKEGYTEIINLLLPARSKVNERDDSGRTALHHAASNGWEDVTQALLGRGADVDTRDKESITPLHLAAENGHEKIVEMLLGHGAYVDINDVYGRTALHCAAIGGQENVVGLLLEKGANIAARDNAGRTPLHYAAGAGGLYKIRDWTQAGNPDVARLLLDKGANINAADKEGRTALHYATFNSVVRRDMAMVQLLVEKGADLDIVDRRGRTPRAIAEWILYETRGAEIQTKYGKILEDITNFLGKNNCSYFVAGDGNDLNPGTTERPFKTVECALRIADIGDVILVRGGTYHCASTVHLDKSGEPGKPIRLRAYSNETPVFDFSRAKGSGFVITGAYWHLKGLTIANAENTGIDLETPGAHHNVLEQICVRYNSDAGLVLRIGVAQNLVLNCDSYRNFDPWTNGENADGFGVSYNVGDGNLFVGCRAWNNSDDGFDFDRAGASLRLENCYVWRNGMNIWNHPCFTGNGSGFKLWDAGHLLIRCAAWDHHGNGFNRGRSVHTAFLKNCTAMRDNINYSFRGAAGTERDVLINNLSCSAGKYIHPDVNDQFNSWNTPPGLEITEKDFLTLDDSVITGPRNADGSIPESDFLRLVPDSDAIDAGTDVGLPFYGKAPDLGAFEYDPDKVKQQSGVKWLHQAVRDHDIMKIQSMLSEKVDVNDKDWLGYAPLHWAVYFGYADVAGLLISQGADPNLLSDTGRTPLEIAKAMEYDELAELLCKHGVKK